MELKLVLPIIILDLLLKIIALLDLSKKNASEVKGNKRITWMFAILLIPTIGPILYLILGMKAHPKEGI